MYHTQVLFAGCLNVHYVIKHTFLQKNAPVHSDTLQWLDPLLRHVHTWPLGVLCHREHRGRVICVVRLWLDDPFWRNGRCFGFGSGVRWVPSEVVVKISQVTRSSKGDGLREMPRQMCSLGCCVRFRLGNAIESGNSARTATTSGLLFWPKYFFDGGLTHVGVGSCKNCQLCSHFCLRMRMRMKNNPSRSNQSVNLRQEDLTFQTKISDPIWREHKNTVGNNIKNVYDRHWQIRYDLESSSDSLKR
jgi:hypothetical protein